jgi:hypothetical protein
MADKQVITVGGIKTWIPIVVLLIAVAGQWAVFGEQLRAVRAEQTTYETRVKAMVEQVAQVRDANDRAIEQQRDAADMVLQARAEKTDSTLVEIKVQLAQIQTDLSYIRKALDTSGR